MKRPLGMRITALMFLLVGLAPLALLASNLPGDAWTANIAKLFYFGPPPLLCIVVAGGIFSVKQWGRLLALIISPMAGLYGLLAIRWGYLWYPGLEAEMAPLPSYTQTLMNWAMLTMWIALLLPFVAYYFLLFDRSTVAAFRKTARAGGQALGIGH